MVHFKSLFFFLILNFLPGVTPMTSSNFEFISLSARCLQRLTLRLIPIALFLSLLLPCATAMAATVTLHLEHADSSLVKGHKIYLREEGGNYDFANPTWQGSDNICTLNGLKEDTTYFFVARTYDKDGNTSDNSNEIKFFQASSQTSPPPSGEVSNPEDPEADQNTPAAPSGGNDAKGGPILNTDALDSTIIANGRLAATQWRVYRTEDDLCVFDATVVPASNEIQLPRLIVEPDVEYYFTARYSAGTAQPLEWIPEQPLMETSQRGADVDDNGILDIQEADPEIDLDADGTPDFLQEEMRSVKTASGEDSIGVSIKGGDNVLSIEQIETLGTADLVLKEDIAVAPQMPIGMINFRLLVNQQGDRAQITLYLPEACYKETRLLYYCYDNIHGWRDHSAYVSSGDEPRTLVVEITDGGAGDADGVANGIIVNQSGPATTHAISIGGGGSSRACFVDSLF